ncbi:MAG: leucine-rich repeat domain-containing protein [Microscillaceae bacterium]|nr:leucine-rich repeat domain-containing protein [Microscillaceae bacterium]
MQTFTRFLIGWLLSSAVACQAPKEQKNTVLASVKPNPTASPENEVNDIPGLHRVEELSPYSGEKKIFTSLIEAQQNPAQVFRLQLNSLRLHQLPAEVWQFKQLEELYVSDNYLTNLPDDLAQKLPRLRILDVSNNHLKRLPSALNQLNDLEYLNISFNQITALPTDFAKLQKLQVLNLENNTFRNLPIEIFSLSNLKHLLIRHLKIKDFSQFLTLKNLQQLSLEDCGISAFPAEIWQFQHLERLSLAHNQLDKIPAEIDRLPKLVYLNLAHNRLKNDLNSLTKLKRLLNLDLSYNPISSIADDWWTNMPQLKAINLSFTALEEVSSQMNQLKGLVWLGLSGTKIRELPTGLGECTRLQDVYLSYNPNLKMSETLQILSNLPKLKALSLVNVRGKQVELSLPKEIANLRYLRKLDLKGNRFGNAEVELNKITKLADLEAVNLSGCGFRQAFVGFAQLKNLRLLGLDIQNMPRSEVQKLPKLLAPQTAIVDGSEFFEYKL